MAKGFDDGGVGLSAAGVNADEVAGAGGRGRVVHAQARAKSQRKDEKMAVEAAIFLHRRAAHRRRMA